jgi:hypothetical protein
MGNNPQHACNNRLQHARAKVVVISKDMRLLQFRDGHGRRAVAASHAGGHRRLEEIETIYELVLAALEAGETLAKTAAGFQGAEAVDVGAAEREGRLLPPLEHPVPTRCWVTGSEGAKAGADAVTSWFFRGSGSTLVGAGQPLPLPAFAPQGVPVPQLVGLFVIADDGVPCQVGWCLGHPIVDAALASGAGAGHARLRATAIGPELLLGDLPAELPAVAKVLRGGKTVAERAFDLGPAGMARPFADLARDHFRYGMHRRPGDVHVHCFGTGMAPTVADAPSPAAADQVFELGCAPLGLPLRNRLVVVDAPAPAVRVL